MVAIQCLADIIRKKQNKQPDTMITLAQLHLNYTTERRTDFLPGQTAVVTTQAFPGPVRENK